MDFDQKIFVSNLIYYPLKSGTEIEANEVNLTEQGIVNDRIFVLLDKKSLEFLNIKKNSKIYYIKTKIIDNKVYIFVPNSEKTFEIDLEKEVQSLDKSRLVFVDMYGMGCNGLVMSNEINSVISNFLNQDVILVYSIEKRYLRDDKEKNLCINLNEEKDKTLFADMAPYLIASDESLEELNRKLKSKGEETVKMVNFRPNIVIKGAGTPYFEDKINKIKIGNVIFRRIKGCVRCKLITFDTEKGKFRKNAEPLETLYEDRIDETLKGPVFAQNFCCDLQGENVAKIKVGDEVIIIE